MASQIRAVRMSSDLNPICPWCEAAVVDVAYKVLALPLGKAYVHSCSECGKVLGVTHRKGFFMG